MPASVAALVLANRTLQWSSPLTFNDPFDVPRDIAFGVTADQLYSELARYVISLLRNPPACCEDFSQDLRQLIKVSRSGFSENFLAVLEQEITCASGETSALTNIEGLRKHWKSLLPSMRILCLTESPRHAAMWYHYADKYQGVALEFNCIDALDSAFLLATPIDYVSEKLPHDTASGVAQLMCLETSCATRRLMDLAVYTKFDDWSYEKEWRIVSFSEDEDSLHSYEKFAKQELAAVYLGPRIAPAERARLTELVRNYQESDIFLVRIEPTRELSFSKLEAE